MGGQLYIVIPILSMMIKGQAKKDYQREYMRDWQRKKRGCKQGLNTGSKQVPSVATVAPVMADYGISSIDADGNAVYDD